MWRLTTSDNHTVHIDNWFTAGNAMEGRCLHSPEWKISGITHVASLVVHSPAHYWCTISARVPKDSEFSLTGWSCMWSWLMSSLLASIHVSGGRALVYASAWIHKQPETGKQTLACRGSKPNQSQSKCGPGTIQRSKCYGNVTNPGMKSQTWCYRWEELRMSNVK